MPRVGGIAFLLSFLLYLRTAAPHVTFIDSGELAAVASSLGVAHPTGYPLFTLIGLLVLQFVRPRRESAESRG